MRTMWIICLMILFNISNGFTQSKNRVWIHMPDTSYNAKLVGLPNTNTQGNSCYGFYNNAKKSHYFNVVISGWYNLYVDVNGGYNFSLDNEWSPRFIEGTDARTFAKYQDSTLTLTEIKRLITTAAKLWLSGSGINSDYLPDDVTISLNATDSTFRVQNIYSYQDTLGSDNPDISKSQWYVAISPDTITGFTGLNQTNHPKDVRIKVLTSGSFVIDSGISEYGITLKAPQNSILLVRYSNGTYKTRFD